MRAALVPALAALLVGCTGESSAPPLRPSNPADNAPLRVSCTADELSVRCRATVFGVGDVTSRTRWWATESFAATAETSAVVFFGAGLATAVQPATVYIRGEYRNEGGGMLAGLAPHSYDMRPGGTPVALAYVSGQVNVPGLGGATVEIIEGEGSGKRDVTRDSGFFMIEHLKLRAPFTIRASKQGFVPEVKTNSGIIDDVYGFPSNNTVNFTLATAAPTVARASAGPGGSAPCLWWTRSTSPACSDVPTRASRSGRAGT